VPLGGLRVDPAELPGITVYRSASAAVRALGHMVRHAAWRRVPHAVPPEPDDERGAAARNLAADLLGATGGGWLEPDQSLPLLEMYGLAPAGVLARDPLAASQAAEQIGFPVAVKVADRTVVHKTDRGLVRVGLKSAAEVMSAVRAFEDELGHGDVPVLVQPVVGGVEVALGVVRDPGFGPLVMVAAGGTATDLWADRAFLLPPIGSDDAARALRSLRIWPLLDGFRSSAPVDVAGLQELVVALGALAAEVPQVAELDLNPVLVSPNGCALVDVKVRLEHGVRLDAGVPRQLRRRP
jgi:acyl-CoA synthetase (NDP forming)